MEVSLRDDDEDGYAGFGDERPHFWIGTGKPLVGRLHVAFAAKNRADVRAFYEAALAAGGIDNGAPGLRPHYHENYYGAFVLDPDGHNIEAVNHLPNEIRGAWPKCRKAPKEKDRWCVRADRS